MTSLTPAFKHTSSDGGKNQVQQSLIDLWAKIEKKLKRNQKYLQDKARLFAEFQATILPLEQQQGRQMIELLEFLIPFLNRKSLSAYQREELLNWMESILTFLRSHPFLTDVDHEALQKKVNDAYVSLIQSQNADIEESHIDAVRMEIEQMFAGDMQLSDEEIIALIRDPNILNQYIQRMNEALDEEDDDESAYSQNSSNSSQPFEDFFEQDLGQDDAQHHNAKDARQKSLDKLFKAGQLNKIYKRLASLLHPDKEQDPGKKAQKHALMQTLSEARKNNDAFTLLQLYQTHINDGEFAFDSDTLSSMQALLREKLHRLDDELHQAKSNNELSTLVWRKFSGRSKKHTENNFKIHLADLEDEIYQKQFIMEQYQTVAQMKKLLQEKVEDNRGWSNDMPVDLMDLFR